MNKYLISKWLFKLLNDKGEVWQELTHNKYLYSKSLSQVTAKPMDSRSFKLRNGENTLFYRGSFKVENGGNTHFLIEVALK
jgi:hypothetical protein